MPRGPLPKAAYLPLFLFQCQGEVVAGEAYVLVTVQIVAIPIMGMRSSRNAPGSIEKGHGIHLRCRFWVA